MRIQGINIFGGELTAIKMATKMAKKYKWRMLGIYSNSEQVVEVMSKYSGNGN